MYKEQLEFIVKALGMLNDFAPNETTEMQLGKIPVVDSDGFVYGHLVDEIGGLWQFVETKEQS